MGSGWPEDHPLPPDVPRAPYPPMTEEIRSFHPVPARSSTSDELGPSHRSDPWNPTCSETSRGRV
jgi:hypothetical protein